MASAMSRAWANVGRSLTPTNDCGDVLASEAEIGLGLLPYAEELDIDLLGAQLGEQPLAGA